jgi:hypothetical protein
VLSEVVVTLGKDVRWVCAVSIVTYSLDTVFTVRPAQAERHWAYWRLLEHERMNRGGSQCGPRAPKCPRILARSSALLFLSSCYNTLWGKKCFLNNFNIAASLFWQNYVVRCRFCSGEHNFFFCRGFQTWIVLSLLLRISYILYENKIVTFLFNFYFDLKIF